MQKRSDEQRNTGLNNHGSVNVDIELISLFDDDDKTVKSLWK